MAYLVRECDELNKEKTDGWGEKTHPARRWVVERTIAWLQSYRALLIRYDKKPTNDKGLIQLACALLWYRQRHQQLQATWIVFRQFRRSAADWLWERLVHLRDRVGRRFRAGVILHTGPETLPFGDRLWAIPAPALWT